MLKLINLSIAFYTLTLTRCAKSFLAIMSFLQLLLVASLCLAVFPLQGESLPAAKPRATTPLDDYVNKPDSTYEYKDLGNSFKGDGYTSYFINMTSQTWLSPSLVSRSVWWHYMVINVPDKILYPDTAFIYITGGSNTDSVPEIGSSDCLFSVTTCFMTGTVTATLFQIPNQRIIFAEDKLNKSRGEDAIIAYTWYHFFNHPDQPEYILRLPMTKAVVRAMDTITDFSPKKNSAANITKFVIGGASKRGWTTWTTGIVDKRVVGMIPIVEDLLNMQKNMHHHYRLLGGWTFAFKDYTDLNITAYVDDPVMKQLTDIVDPYSYLDRLTMPKFLINSGGDEFFMPDDNHYFWDDLPDDKYFRMLPNAEHSCAGHYTSLIFAVRAFYLSILTNTSRPKMTWKMENNADGGSITMSADIKPKNVKVFHATTIQSQRRDFRLLSLLPGSNDPIPQPVLWSEQELQPDTNGDYVAIMASPEEGWRAFFIQATFPVAGTDDALFEFTTQVNVIPDTFPFPDCQGKACQGHLV